MKNRAGLILLFITDAITIVAIFYLSVALRQWVLPRLFEGLPEFEADIWTYYWIFFLWFGVVTYEGGYSRRFTFWDEVKFVWKSVLFTAIIIFAILFVGKQGALFSRAVILNMALLSFVVIPLTRPLFKRLIYSLGLMKRKVLIIGAGRTGRTAKSALESEPNLGYEVAGFVDDEEGLPRMIDGIKVHRGVDRIERYIRRCGIQDVVIAKPELEKDRLTSIINRIQHKVENTLYIPDISGIAVLGTELRHFFYEQTIVIEIKNNLEHLGNYIIKRGFDYMVALIISPFLLVIIAVISCVIRLNSQGPALFRQTRIGKDGKPFMCYKFRTMYVDAEERLEEILANDPEKREEWEKFWKLKDDPRVTSVGRFLRRTSLDELPQIINVLKGEMSLVGPRPYLPREKEYLGEYAELILSLPPGITGLWQVSGRSNTDYEHRVRLDGWYVRNWNLWLDVVILLKTVPVILRREGAR